MSDESHGVSEENGESRTPVPLPVARLSDAHLQEGTRYPRRVERIVMAAFVLGIVCIAGFGAAYWVNAKPWALAATFGAGLVLLGFGLTAWGKYLMPRGPFVEERHPLRSSDAEREAMAAAVVERTDVVVKRRPVLGGLFAAGAGLFGIVALFPLLRSLGPLPGDTLQTTNWRRGDFLVDSSGNRIPRDGQNSTGVLPYIAVGGLVTVFPEGYQNTDQGQAVDQTVLIRYSLKPFTTMPGRESWTPEGYVAYSKMCTHLGCPVGLYEQQLGYLVCPCHQSMFNVADGAVPLFGPAPRPLPQLPLTFQADPVTGVEYLAAQAGYDQAVGPGFWERSTT